MGKTSLGGFSGSCEGMVAGRDTDREYNGVPGALALFSSCSGSWSHGFVQLVKIHQRVCL